VKTIRLSSKGRVVIPKSLRDRLRLGAGAVLSVAIQNNAIVLHQVGKAPRLPTDHEIDAVAGCLKIGGPMPSREQEEAALSAFFRAQLSS